ncbi:MAG: 30S ribosomal protein S20 [Chloroflexota bacterium]
MANTAAAKKRIRSSARRQARNRVYRASARTYVKNTRKALAAGALTQAEEQAQMAYSVLDKAARKGIVHPRNAARRKGRLMAALAAAQSKQ